MLYILFYLYDILQLVEIKCPTLAYLNNLQLSAGGQRIGDEVTLTCSIEYRLRDKIPENFLCEYYSTVNRVELHQYPNVEDI